jgi:hypothetical protein
MMMTTTEQSSSSLTVVVLQQQQQLLYLLVLFLLLLLLPLIGVVWKRQYQLQRPLAKQQFTHTITVTRHLPNTSLAQAYAKCLRAWRVDNLGLPKPSCLSIMQPQIIQPGHVTTGVGLICQRWMPLGSCLFRCSHLQEGIVGFQESSSKRDTMETWMQMEYKVLNPSYCTWPVYNHLGRVRFTATTTFNNKNNNNNSNKDSVLVVGGGCRMEWTVQWTPLPVPIIPFWDKILTWITTMVIETAGNYMAATAKEEELQDLSKNS